MLHLRTSPNTIDAFVILDDMEIFCLYSVVLQMYIPNNNKSIAHHFAMQ